MVGDFRFYPGASSFVYHPADLHLACAIWTDESDPCTLPVVSPVNTLNIHISTLHLDVGQQLQQSMQRV